MNTAKRERNQVTWLVNIENSDGTTEQREFATYEEAKAFYAEAWNRWDIVEVSEPEGVMV
jgi:hypothetical protein